MTGSAVKMRDTKAGETEKRTDRWRNRGKKEKHRSLVFRKRKRELWLTEKDKFVLLCYVLSVCWPSLQPVHLLTPSALGLRSHDAASSMLSRRPPAPAMFVFVVPSFRALPHFILIFHM